MSVIEHENMENERKGILPVRNDKIRQNSVGMHARADHPFDYKGVVDDLIIREVNDKPLIRGINAALSFRVTERTALILWMKILHKSIKPSF